MVAIGTAFLGSLIDSFIQVTLHRVISVIPRFHSRKTGRSLGMRLVQVGPGVVTGHVAGYFNSDHCRQVSLEIIASLFQRILPEL